MKKRYFKEIPLIAVILIAFTSCAGAHSEAYVNKTDLYGIKITETMTFDAKGDIIYQITECMEMDFSELTADETAEYKDIFKSSVADAYSSVDGVTCANSMENGIYKIEAVIPANEQTLSALSETGVMQFHGTGKILSLKATGKALESSGFTKKQ